MPENKPIQKDGSVSYIDWDLIENLLDWFHKNIDNIELGHLVPNKYRPAQTGSGLNNTVTSN